MSGFHLSIWIKWLFEQLASHGSPTFAVCVFGVLAGYLAYYVLQGIIWVSPYAWRRTIKGLKHTIDWQVDTIFRWARWHAQTRDSLWWAVVCAFTLSTAILIALRLPVLLPLLLIVLPTSFVTFTILGWRDRGERATRSWRAVIRFIRSFFIAIMIPTIGYTAVAAFTAFIVFLWDYF